MKNARIGAGCNIGQNVVISPDVVVGDNVKIQNNVSVYTGCILEDDVFCGPSMVFTNVINPRSHVCAEGRIQDDACAPRRVAGRQLHGRVRHHDRPVRLCRRGFGGDPRCPRLRAGVRQPGAAARVDVRLRCRLHFPDGDGPCGMRRVRRGLCEVREQPVVMPARRFKQQQENQAVTVIERKIPLLDLQAQHRRFAKRYWRKSCGSSIRRSSFSVMTSRNSSRR